MPKCDQRQTGKTFNYHKPTKVPKKIMFKITEKIKPLSKQYKLTYYFVNIFLS